MQSLTIRRWRCSRSYAVTPGRISGSLAPGRTVPKVESSSILLERAAAISLSMLTSRLISASACCRQELRSTAVWSWLPDGREYSFDGLENREQPANVPARTNASNVFVMMANTNQGVDRINVVPAPTLCNRNLRAATDDQSKRPKLARS